MANESERAKNSRKGKNQPKKSAEAPVASPVRVAAREKTPGGSGNPGAPKRVKGKQCDADKDRQIAELKKAGTGL